MADGSGKVRKGRKFDQVLDGARQVFMTDGFEGASVDEIARVAGVSKATLYSYFPDKRLLFMEVAKGQCARQADAAVETMDMTGSVQSVLKEAATQMLDFMTSDFGQRIFRICVAESERFPDIGRDFYNSGPALVRSRLIEFFEQAVARGELVIEDYELAAEQFHELCKANILNKLVFNMLDDVTDVQKQRTINGAVEMFIARYGTKG